MTIVEKCLCGNELSLEWNDNEEFKMVRCPSCNNEMRFRNPNFNGGSGSSQMMNYRMHAEGLFVPVINGLQVEDDNNPQTILLAIGDGLTQQLTSDGYIEDGEFENRIQLVIDNTKQFMINSGCENVDNSFIYYKDYSNGVFNFKVYVQDMIINVENQKQALRSFVAYFVEPKMHDFYQLTLTAGPFDMAVEQLKTGVIDLEQDQITIMLDNLMKALLDNLKYKN